MKGEKLMIHFSVTSKTNRKHKRLINKKEIEHINKFIYLFRN